MMNVVRASGAPSRWESNIRKFNIVRLNLSADSTECVRNARVPGYYPILEKADYAKELRERRGSASIDVDSALARDARVENRRRLAVSSVSVVRTHIPFRISPITSEGWWSAGNLSGKTGSPLVLFTGFPAHKYRLTYAERLWKRNESMKLRPYTGCLIIIGGIRKEVIFYCVINPFTE